MAYTVFIHQGSVRVLKSNDGFINFCTFWTCAFLRKLANLFCVALMIDIMVLCGYNFNDNFKIWFADVTVIKRAVCGS